MKICFVLNSHWSSSMGGAEYQSLLLMQELQKSPNVELHYLCRNSDSQDSSIKVVKSGLVLAKYAYFFDSAKLYKALKSLDPDVVYHRNAGAYTGVCAYYCYRHGKKFIWNLAHDKDVTPANLSDIKNLFKFFDKMMLEYGLRRRQIIIAQTLEQQALLEEHYKINDSILIPNYHPLPEEKRKKQNTDIKQVLWVANFKPTKRPEDFISLARAFRGNKSVRFVMVGKADHAYKKILREVSEELEQFRYLDSLSQPEVNNLISESDLFVNTSISEGFPNTFIQSWLRGIPVMSMRVDPSKIISRERVGVIAPDINSMIKAVHHLLATPKSFEQMGKRAASYARLHHSLKNVDRIKQLMGIKQ